MRLTDPPPSGSQKPDAEVIGSSFRDPSGHVFELNGEIYRQVNHSFQPNYDFLQSSGLYDDLTSSGWLVAHEKVDVVPPFPESLYCVIKPERIPLISYPYEWCFTQLKDAALLTLRIQRRALDFGMSLKDASAYNVQFLRYRPIFIDTLSFERREEGHPWPAYRQFCQHFLAPLLLVSHLDGRLSHLLRVFVDGIPLDLASRMLGSRGWFRLGILTHLHLHARTIRSVGRKNAPGSPQIRRVSTSNLRAMIDNIEAAINRLEWTPRDSEWAGYYEDTNYTATAEQHKSEIISRFLKRARPASVWDFGANTGRYARLAASVASHTAAFDADAAAVDANYKSTIRGNARTMLPLVLDLANPSPDLGWAGEERMSIFRRGPADLVMALALIHHLAIANNVPLDKLADFFAKTCEWLIVEFVPKSDSQVRRMLSSRADVFPNYTQEQFESAFLRRFSLIDSAAISSSDRTLYLMRATT